MNKELVLVKVSGPDKPGITYSLMTVIEKGEATLYDVGQSVTHGLLSLSILLYLNPEKSGHPVIKDLLFEAKRQGLSLDFEIINEDSEVKNSSDNQRFILSCVSRDKIGAGFLKEIAGVLSKHQINILRIDKIGTNGLRSLEISTTVPEGLDWDKIKTSLMQVSSNHQVDVAFLKDNVFRRNKRLIVFDMDSTLIQAEVIDELAEVHGVGAQVKQITEEAMNGRINFDESLRRRVAMLKGLEETKLKQVLERLPLTEGAEDFIRTVKSLGYKVAVISGGFSYFANAFKDRLGLDYAFSNELDFKDGKLTGEVKQPIVNAEYKAMLLKMLAQQLQINLEQVVAIGDGANDLPMLSVAGLGIAFHAKEIVRKKAGHHMSHGPMTSILYFLGIPGTLDGN
jgi:phosphoserine phosphatase